MSRVDVIAITEKLYKKGNPTSKMDVPSMVYEIVERHFKHWLTLPERIRPEFEKYADLMTTADPISKDDAILCLSLGCKMSHRSFLGTEHIQKWKNSLSYYKDENDNVINAITFWKYRTKDIWDTGWSLYRKEK